MTNPDDAVAAIDAALEAWESGPDAYRWEPDAEAGVARGSEFDPVPWLEIARFIREYAEQMQAEFQRMSSVFAEAFIRLEDQARVLWLPDLDPVLTDETKRLLVEAPTDAALAMLVPATCGEPVAVVVDSTWNAPTGVGNSSRVPESTNTPQGPQDAVQGRTGASQREREGA